MSNSFSIQDAHKAEIVTVEDGRGGQAVHDLIVAFRANRRSGSANTKTRGEVSATGKKPFRQKGTGRARQGGNASPIHRGGGVAFGPRPRDYSKTVNKKVRSLAFARALTERIEQGDVILASSLGVSDGKTKSFVEAIGKVTDAKKVLVVGWFDDLTFRAARNVSKVLLMSPEEVNVEQLLYYDKVVLTSDALGVLSTRTKGVASKRDETGKDA